MLDSFSIRTTVLVLVLPSGASSTAAQAPPSGAAPAGFHLLEATIEDIHGAFQSKRITCRELVNLYIKRIEAWNNPRHFWAASGCTLLETGRTGIESLCATANPVAALVTPGPVVTQQTPGFPVDRA